MSQQIEIYDDAAALAREGALQIESKLKQAVERYGKARWSLAGGSTPQRLYEELAARHQQGESSLPWGQVEILFGDERAVDPEDQSSNYRMAREAMLSKLPIPQDQIYRIEGELGANLAARDYRILLSQLFDSDDERLDIALLGMGDDGHTASLLPGSPLMQEDCHWAAATEHYQGIRRITLTPPALERASQLIFLVSGEAKATMLQRVLGGDESLPAGYFARNHPNVLWLLDKAAASALER